MTPKKPDNFMRARLAADIERTAAALNGTDWHQLAQFLEQALVKDIRNLENRILQLRAFPPRVRGYGEPRSIFLGDADSAADAQQRIDQVTAWRDKKLQMLDFVTACGAYASNAEAEDFGRRVAEHFRKEPR